MKSIDFIEIIENNKIFELCFQSLYKIICIDQKLNI